MLYRYNNMFKRLIIIEHGYLRNLQQHIPSVNDIGSKINKLKIKSGLENHSS